MTKFSCGIFAALLALAGCGGDESRPIDNVATPSEGAKVNNQNPTTQTIDVPNTPKDEAALAKPDEATPKPE